MKFFRTVFLLLAFCAAAGISSAGEVRVIELTDGSVITGEVLSMSGGVYTIRSDSLGTLTINESKIKAVRQMGASSSNQGDANAPVQSLQQRMQGDQEIMTVIRSLQNDPEFKKVLEDPAVMKAVQAGDVSALMANPQFLKLLQNPSVQDIRKRIEK